MLEEEIIQKIVNNEIKFYEVEKFIPDKVKATHVRRRALEKLTGCQLIHTGNFSLEDFPSLRFEPTIGVCQYPVSIAGPVKVNGDYAKGEFFIPLATTEGALPASVNRGISAINAAGGANVVITQEFMSRAPCLASKDVKTAQEVKNKIIANFEEIKEIADSADPYVKLKKIDVYTVANLLFPRFMYDTFDAMGMNGVTKATDKAAAFIEKKFSLKHVALSGNMCVDKKPSALNLIQGRGRPVTAEVTIPEAILKKKLKVSIDTFLEVNFKKNWIGSAKAGSLAFNAHIANVIAAIFIATGQDEAHPVDSSLGFDIGEKRGNSLYFAVDLPCLEVAAFGGGTGYGTTKEMLKLMQCYGPGDPPGANAKKFAEIVAVAVLAGELSLISSLGERTLTRAHMILARGESK